MMYSEREPFADAENDYPNNQTDAPTVIVDNSTVPCDDGCNNIPVDAGHATEYASADNGTEPATSDAEAVDDAVAGTPMPGTDNDAVEGGDDSNGVPDYGSEYNKLPEGMYFENGILFEGAKPVPDDRRVTGQVRVTGDLRDRIKVVSNLERRKMTAVVEEAVKQFLEKGINEPRPYLPYTSAPQTARIAWYMTPDQDAMLRGRAMSEGRDLMTIVRRALLDYVEASPYDPLRLMRPEPSATIPGADAVESSEEAME